MGRPRKEKILICDCCSGEFTRRLWKINRCKRRGLNRVFCSRKCFSQEEKERPHILAQLKMKKAIRQLVRKGGRLLAEVERDLLAELECGI